MFLPGNIACSCPEISINRLEVCVSAFTCASRYYSRNLNVFSGRAGKEPGLHLPSPSLKLATALMLVERQNVLLDFVNGAHLRLNLPGFHEFAFMLLHDSPRNTMLRPSFHLEFPPPSELPNKTKWPKRWWEP